MQTRRFDEELSEWFQVLKGASTALSRSDASVSHYLQALSHLVDDSLRYAATHHTTQMLSRSHVGEILEIVRRHNGKIERDRLLEVTGLADSRLSQLLSELTVAGALERGKEGRQARFSLTDTGREWLEAWSTLRRVPQDSDGQEEVEEGAEEWRSWTRAVQELSAVDADDSKWPPIFDRVVATEQQTLAKPHVSIKSMRFSPDASEEVWSSHQYQWTKTKGAKEHIDV